MLEPLETRKVPVIGASAFAAAVPAGGEFDGVVRVTSTYTTNDSPPKVVTSTGTGTLLASGRHVLTAAHVIDHDFNGLDGAVSVQFDMIRQGTAIPVSFTVPSGGIAIHSNPSVNDIAILTLGDDLVAGGQSVAPFKAQRYDLFSGDDGLKTFTMVGYGETGIGPTGNQQDEVQRVTINNPVGGTFQLTIPQFSYFGQTLVGPFTTGPISQTATAEDVAEILDDALQATFGAGTTAVTKNSANQWDVRFVNGLGGASGVPEMSDSDTVDVTTQFEGGTGASGTKRSGQNRFDGINLAQNILFSDFDNGNPANDAIVLTPTPDLGVANEVSIGRGDSGGPGFIRNTSLNTWELASVTSFIAHTQTPPDVNNYVDGDGDRAIPNDADPVPDSSFGELAAYTRVSAYTSFINSNIGGSYDLVFDMNKQVLGLDGLTENLEIKVTLNGLNLQIEVINNSSSGTYAGIYYSAPVSQISSLKIHGSGDNETIKIIGDLGIASVNVDAGLGTNVVFVPNGMTTQYTVRNTSFGNVTLAAYGTSGNDIVDLTPSFGFLPAPSLGSVSFRSDPTLKPIRFDHYVTQVNFDAIGGSANTVFVGNGSYNQLLILNETAGAGVTVAAYGTTGNDTVQLTPALTTTHIGSVSFLSGGLMPIQFSGKVAFVNFDAAEGPDNVVYVANGTTNQFLIFNEKAGAGVTVAAYGTTGNDTVQLTPALTTTHIGSVSFLSGGLNPIKFTGKVTRVNFDAEEGSDNVVYVASGTTNQFLIFNEKAGAGVTLAAYGTTGNDTVQLTPALTTTHIGSVSFLSGGLNPIQFTGKVTRVNFDGTQGADT